MAFGRWKKYINNGYSSSQNVFGHSTSSFEIVFLTTNQVFMMNFSHPKKYINDGLSSSQNIFGRPTSSYKVVFSTTNQVFMTTFSRLKNTLTMTLVHRKLYLVVQLPHMKKYFRRKISSAYDDFLRLKMSVNDGLVSNKVLPTEVDGHLPLALLICDDFLCCCDKL